MTAKKRRYGQHFLTDPAIVRRIVEASGAGKGDAVLEIGPGRGALTRALAGQARKVLAIEIDRRLHAGLLAAGLPENVTLVLGDALRMSDADIGASLGPDYRLVSNLPYEITSAALQRFLTASPPPRNLTLMVQREVGERIMAKPGEMNRLALFCGYYAEAERLFAVPPGAFSPPPMVHSCVIRLTPRRTKPLRPEAERRFFGLIEAAFSQKRRSLKNSLASFCGAGAEKTLKDAGLPASIRPQDLSFPEWISLALKMC